MGMQRTIWIVDDDSMVLDVLSTMVASLGYKVRTFSAEAVHDQPDWVEAVIGELSGDLYVTIDLDVLDPAIMPATGTPEPGGVSWRQVLDLLRAASKTCAIRGFDVVELSPLPGMVAPDFLATKLIYRIMGYIASR